MRLFTTDEEILLRRIRDGQGRNLYSLIDPWIHEVSFRVNTQTNSVTFIFQANPGLNLLERLEQIQSIVIQSVNLIKLFEDKGYIFTFINANQLPPNPFTFGQAAINLPSIPYQFPDPRISKMFCEYSTREIFVTPELNKFINDGFITREEVRANRQYRTTRNAFFVAIFALLFNIGFNAYNKWTSSTYLEKFHKEKAVKNKIKSQKNDTVETNSQSDTVITITTTITSRTTDTIKK